VLWLQPACTVPKLAGCWGRDNVSGSSCFNCLPSASLVISISSLPLHLAADASHSAQHYMAHHMHSKSSVSVQFNFANKWDSAGVVVAGVRMSDCAQGSVQWLSTALDALTVAFGDGLRCSVTLPSTRSSLQMQICCFACGSGSACCSPWLLLDDAALLLLQPLLCSAACLSQVLRAVSDRCSHRARASVAVISRFCVCYFF
jgi:hypothetical protein